LPVWLLMPTQLKG